MKTQTRLVQFYCADIQISVCQHPRAQACVTSYDRFTGLGACITERADFFAALKWALATYPRDFQFV